MLTGNCRGVSKSVKKNMASWDKDGEERVTIWIKEEGRLLSGNNRPKKKHLARYFRQNPSHEVYTGQKQNAASFMQNRVAMWNLLTGKKVTGAACPLEKNLSAYLRQNPHMTVYAGHAAFLDFLNFSEYEMCSAPVGTPKELEKYCTPSLVVRETVFEDVAVVVAAFD